MTILSAAIGGYERGRDARERREARAEDREWMRGRRERKTGMEEWRDPMERGAAERGEAKGIRDEEYESSGEMFRRAERRRKQEQAERDEQYNVGRQGSRMRGIGRSEAEAIRQEQLGAAQQGPAMRAIPRQEAAAVRQEEIGAAGQPGALAGVEYEDQRAADEAEVWGSQMEGWRERQDDMSYKRDADNAIGGFEATGNPQPLQDFFNDVYENDAEVEIEKLQDGTYQATYSDGRVSVATKDELLKTTRDFFMSRPDTAADQGFGGVGGAGRRGAAGPGGARGPGQRGTTGKQSAYAEKVYMLADNYMKSEGLSDVEALAKAHTVSGRSSRKHPQEVAQGFFKDLLKSMLPDSDQGYSEDERRSMTAEAVKEATELTKQFMGIDFSGYNGGGAGINQGTPAPQGAAEGAAQPSETQIQRLIDNPERAEEFDRKFQQPGLAERILNGS